MAGGKERALRRRIKSVQSTKKITKAMELISASRIAKAQQRVAAARPYSEKITEVIRNLAAAGAAPSSPLLQERDPVRRVAVVVIAADRGLAGAYNSTVIRAAEHAVRDIRDAGLEYSLVTVGRKPLAYFRFRGYKIEQSFTGFSDQPAYENARQIAQFVAQKFEDGTYDRVELAYTQFLSVGTQRAVVRRLIPLDAEAITDAAAAHEGPQADYEFEPEPTEILDRLLPRYVEARLFAALLESAASEHAARQRAMKSATDNAEELITKLTRVMNRARQDAITTEIMEIVGGAEALSQDKTQPEELLLLHTDWPHVYPHDPHQIAH
jgi:F-type H+-transporting ATPase subunit gamma